MNRTALVALVPCATYEQSAVDEAVRTGVDLLGGVSAFASPEERVLLKPNLLGRAAPEKAVTTHPAVFGAVARLFHEAGFSCLTYGDSPGSPTTTPERAAASCGMDKQAAKWGVTFGDFEHSSLVRFPQGHVCRSFELCKGVQECDAMVNLAKMKTHALERITGAVKNLYGCICSLNKAVGHARFPDSDLFADMLCDLQLCVKPRLHILDGITAMEGNGPTSGTPVPMNMLLFSADPVALDSLYACLIHLSPDAVPTCVSGSKRGLGVMEASCIRVLTPEGEITVEQAVARFGKEDFDVFRGQMCKSFVMKLTPLLPFLQSRPRVDLHKCIACGVCMEACPVPGKAVHSGGGHKAKYDYHKCIRCFCCQEMCPAKAISVYRSPLNKLIGGR